MLEVASGRGLPSFDDYCLVKGFKMRGMMRMEPQKATIGRIPRSGSTAPHLG
jgi:hypothetical protein